VLDAARTSGAGIDPSIEDTPAAYGATAGDFLPSSLMFADGRLIVGAVNVGRDTTAHAGAVYLLSEIGFGDDLSMTTPLLVGSRQDEGLGAAIAAGDINGDGAPDLIVLAAGPVLDVTPAERAVLYAIKSP
jgi:hypothetical protein